MEKGLWVRSQEKRKLILCDSFVATPNGTVLGFQGADDVEGVPLGNYETEERAIEVLHLLQNNCKREFKTANMPPR